MSVSSFHLADINSAQLFITKLPETVVKIEWLKIRVGLEERDEDDHEALWADLTILLQSMKIFKDFVQAREARTGQKIKTKWEKFGFLEGLAERGPMQQLMEGVF